MLLQRYNAAAIDTERTITVQFLTRTAKGIPWQFEPMINEVKYIQVKENRKVLR